MVSIASGNEVVTLINFSTVSPENQQKLVDMLIEATQKTMRHVPGFVSVEHSQERGRHTRGELCAMAQGRRLRGDAGRSARCRAFETNS
jgi:hypothetical protein